MFSATYAYDVEEWCKLNLDNVIAVFVGVRWGIMNFRFWIASPQLLILYFLEII